MEDAATNSHPDDKLKINVDDPVIFILQEKLNYHMEQIRIHQRGKEEVEKVLSFMKSDNTQQTISEFNAAAKNFEHSINLLKNRRFWMEASIKTIEMKNRPLQTTEIFNEVAPDVTIAEGISIKGILSAALTELYEDGKLRRFRQVGAKGFFYGTPRMFDSDESSKH